MQIYVKVEVTLKYNLSQRWIGEKLLRQEFVALNETENLDGHAV